MSIDKTKLIEEVDQHIKIIRNHTAEDLRQYRRYKQKAKQYDYPSIYFEGMQAFLRGRVSSNKIALSHMAWLTDSINRMEELS